MPIPHGWTERQVKLRDKIAKKLEGKPGIDNPWAVATAHVERLKARHREKHNG